MSNGNGMTSGEMLRELWQDFRDFKSENHAAHDKIAEKLAEIDKRTTINTTKVGVFSSLVALIVAGLVTFGLNAFGG